MKQKFNGKFQKLRNRLRGGSGSVLKILTRPSFVSVISIMFLVVLMSGLSVFAFDMFKTDQSSPVDGEVSYAEVITLLESELEAYQDMKLAVEAENEQLRILIDRSFSEVSDAYSLADSLYSSMIYVSSIEYMYNVLGITSSQLNTYRSAFGSGYFPSNAYDINFSFYQRCKAGLNLYETTDGSEILGSGNHIFTRDAVYEDVYAVDLLYTYYSYIVSVYEANTGILSNPNYEAEVAEKLERRNEAYALYQFYQGFMGYSLSNYVDFHVLLSDMLSANMEYLHEIDNKMSVIVATIIELGKKVN
ncbi:MAG: hypothetical protein LBP62_02980 [Clostridiales bacterium]|jgi:hypothetical protein|nr:hypothetical protein [Clostridiales bacterium]